ncbi:dolichyl pyrophosphate Man9GlcNAc2 alpha-1:3-glucosyltransferase-like protein [Leptotrombidium deliense]|uniref:Alpha-1,3-glucosyltransferase n=1 Tax=Leptotrombidium deliense TaxID=299467 RepID=A0A443S597_9ACAR|nr:dolichyl pyrophosphate Man9GlcNAc2 alpha-1:3-glucosyltransferase-like protein [Leptotrombidium deliense]
MKDPFLPFGVLLALLVRWTVSRFPYSGAGKPPLYGDYEAQRHWMEITVNLEPKEWYKNSTLNDLQYWGLDYPPLTAYHMFVNGKIAEFYDPSWVKLNDSRGTHGYYHKLFMRTTVMFSDLLYIGAILLYWSSAERPVKDRDKALFATLSLLYPGLILIDHGHFQYNCVSLGLTLFAVIFLESGSLIFGSLAFCLALNYKQMSLYHALPFFAYLLGISLKQQSIKNCLRMLSAISLTVIVTFYVIWLPFTGDSETFMQVVRRLFPFDRGLYEDKVANIWCSMEVILKLKQLLSFKTLGYIRHPSIKGFKYCLVNSSLVFFLLSFQVHEKSILLVSLPVLLLLHDCNFVAFWFCIVSVFR